MKSLALSLLAVFAFATTSYGEEAQVVIPAACGQSSALNLHKSARVSISDDIPLGGSDCVHTFNATDRNNECVDAFVMCVNVTSINSMCYVNAEFSSNTKILKLKCMASAPKTEWCVNGQRAMTLRFYQNPDRNYQAYGLTAKVSARCVHYDINPNKGGQSALSPDEENIIFVDVEEAVHNTRVIGIVVGVCLACMFLIALLVTYFYYKNKAYTGVPQDA